jgi:hypothetical protein
MSIASKFQFSQRTWSALRKTAIVAVTPVVPALIWWKYAKDERHKRAEEVRTRVRVPNVQTVDDIMVEKCKPGDVILFDRRCELCAAGPGAALACVIGRRLLCDDGDDQVRSVDHGRFDHCGKWSGFLLGCENSVIVIVHYLKYFCVKK